MHGAIVLCGGSSTRMGRDKAWLPLGARGTMLQHVVSIVQQATPNASVVVVAARGQHVPPLPPDVTLVHESTGGTGPLSALIEGLERLPVGVEAAFACGCDAPLLRPALIDRLWELWAAPIEAVVPVDDHRLHPLAAIYARSCLGGLREALASGERSLHRALRRGHVVMREARVDELRAVDPELDSLVNCNTPEEYDAARMRVHA